MERRCRPSVGQSAGRPVRDDDKRAEHDRRRDNDADWGTKSYPWQKLYNGRSAVERVNSRIDCVLGFERHTNRGRKKMKMRRILALAVMLAMALGRIGAGPSDPMRSLVARVSRAA